MFHNQKDFYFHKNGPFLIINNISSLSTVNDIVIFKNKIISVKELMKKIFNYSDEEVQNILKEIKKEKEDPLLKDFYSQDEF